MTDHQQQNGPASTDVVASVVTAVASLPLDQRKVLTVAIASDLTYLDIADQGKFEAAQVLDWMREGLHSIADALTTGEQGQATE
ncbi:MAG: hypothetical protein R2839_04225 [Thermomicrobiales bacterium]